MSAYPLRVRLHGGRNTHCARPFSDGTARLTACDYYLAAGSSNHWVPDTDPVTCPACNRAIGKDATP